MNEPVELSAEAKTKLMAMAKAPAGATLTAVRKSKWIVECNISKNLCCYAQFKINARTKRIERTL